MGRLRRFLPPQVADLIVASGSEKQLESHRREITALFCDLRGFTALSDHLPGETVIEALDDYFEHVAAAVHAAHGGDEKQPSLTGICYPHMNHADFLNLTAPNPGTLSKRFVCGHS